MGQIAVRDREQLMSGADSYPPPGGRFPAPGEAAPESGRAAYPWATATAPGGYPPPQGPPPGYLPPPHLLAAAHKPGAIPLRPLALGDLYDAAFKIIRFNPKATVGSSVIVTAVAMTIPVIVTGILSLTVGVSLDVLDEQGQPDSAEIAGLAGAYGALLIGAVLQWLGMIFVTGMNAHVASAAAIGHQLTLGEAWAATRGKRWRLVGMMLLLLVLTLLFWTVIALMILVFVQVLPVVLAVLFGIAVGIAAVVGMCFLWVRVYYLAVPPLMLEPIGVFTALGRAWALTRRQFWRTFGIALLTLLVANFAGGMLTAPISIIGQVVAMADPGGSGFFWLMVSNSLAQVLAAALVAPFVTTVTSLQYLDQRIRKEAYDVELMARVGITAS